MSQAPVRRKSRQAMAAAVANTASSKPAPHRVVLRVKRKRGDDPVEGLLVATDEGEDSGEQGLPNRKRHAADGTGSIEETMADLSLEKAPGQHAPHKELAATKHVPSRLFYKRVRTTEQDGSSDRKKGRPPPAMVTPPSSSLGGAPGPTVGGGGGGRLDALLTRRGMDSHASLFLPPRPAAVLDFMEVRRVKARAVGKAPVKASSEGEHRPASPSAVARSDFHVIDLQAVGRGQSDGMDISAMGGGGRGGAADGAVAATAKRTAAAPILTPVERQVDEAIFTAFQTGDMSSLRDLLETSSSPSPSGVNYRRRLGDATTALMAAAFHGDLDTVRLLLSLGAKASLVDAAGKSAAVFAGMRGHRECFAELQRAADEEEEQQRARSVKRRASAGGGAGGEEAGGDGHDFVYDLYYFQPSASVSPAGEASAAAGEGGAVSVTAACGKLDEKAPGAFGGAPPVVRLSGIGPVDENAVGTTADVELEFAHDSDWSDLGAGDDGEDPDSNSEGYYGNDYPEDEGDEEDGVGVTPYIYGGGSGSSCASENGSSSSDDGAFDSDSDDEPYSRRVVEMMPDDDGDGGVGVAGLVQSMPRTKRGTTQSTFHAGLGDASEFAWTPKR